ncbi:MAG: hypothetical protein AAGJ35_11185, partial [Myxococcota bacterium]
LKRGEIVVFVKDLEDLQSTEKEVRIPITKRMIDEGSVQGVMKEVGVIVEADRFPQRIRFAIQLVDALTHRSKRAWMIVQQKN